MTDVLTACASSDLTLKMTSSESSDLTLTSSQVVETSVTNNSLSQDSNNPDDLFQSRYVSPGYKQFS